MPYREQSEHAHEVARQARDTFPEGDPFVQTLYDAAELWDLATRSHKAAILRARSQVRDLKSVGARHFLAQIGA